MSDVVIRVEELGKRYALGERQRYLALRDVLANFARNPFRSLRRQPQEHLWALRDVSLEIREGEVVGLIGRNGAGKTTLLKLLARITRPTEGHAEVRGRVGSLLEVGTGFHPELTGRENVFLGGAILGMTRREIEAKFDEIVVFADVEKFIDTPLKHYSSGMQMRLAFAVAAHLEPEILLVDEVLAVGDIEFQKKCLGKMGEVARGGRTILFVSHQMNQIRRLCERVIWLDAGRVRQVGPTQQVLSQYEENMLSRPANTREELTFSSPTHFVSWEVVDPRGESSNIVAGGSKRVTLKVLLETSERVTRGLVGAYIYDANSRLLAGWAVDGFQLETGIHDMFLSFPYLPLRPGAYHLHVCVYDDKQLKDYWHAVPSLVIEDKPVTHFMDEWAGVLNVPCKLEFKRKGAPVFSADPE